jgi:predicted ATPase
MPSPFIRRLRLDGFLSFAPGTEPFDLQPLNVLIGPNGSGKSNVIEAVELLHATPTNFATAIREGAGPDEWLWEGEAKPGPATVDVELDRCAPTGRPLRYRLEFAAVQSRVAILDEGIE